LDAIKNFIKTSTSSMTAVPKPLKFLRPHYDDLAALYEKWTAGLVKVGLAIGSFTITDSDHTSH
jgi:26S proteasome regulatory subunit N1